MLRAHAPVCERASEVRLPPGSALDSAVTPGCSLCAHQQRSGTGQESHVLPPQPAPLVPIPLRPLLQIHENQLTAVPLKPWRVVRPSEQEGEAEQEVVWPGFGLIYLPDPGKPQQSSVCQTGTT